MVRDAEERARLAEAAQLFEAAQAQELIDAFVVELDRRGVAPHPLSARLTSGARVRSDARGWYLKNDQSIGIGQGGEYFVLVVAGGLAERLRGVRLTPRRPTLVVSPGARDGQTGDLGGYLERALLRYAGDRPG